MTTEYNYEKQLIKDFIRHISDHHMAGIVQFPDEFKEHQYVSYRFVNTCDLLDQFIEERNNV